MGRYGPRPSITIRKKVFVLRRFRLALLPLVAVAVTVAGLATADIASAASAPSSPTLTTPGRLVVGVQVMRFTTAGRSVHAAGLVTAKLTGNSGQAKTITQQVALTASTSGGCKILHLYLQQLSLTLLGLNVNLSKVNLDVTGHKGQGVLGNLFCALANAKVGKLARVAKARALTSAFTKRQHSLRFTAYIHPAATTSTAAGATCPVLNLVLGPLDLQLLGLEVSLNQINLNVTATNGAGVLGNLFCQLANGTLPTTTTTP